MEIIHLRKYRWRRGGDGGAPHDAELRWLHGNNDDKRDNDDSDSDENFFEHGISPDEFLGS
jgi:hypothetical protein